jgi:hypothetical protein
MATMLPFLAGIYYLVILAVVGYLLHLITRSVKALEKISDTYVKKNTHV